MLKENKIQSGQDISDLANIFLGGMDNIMTLISLNPKFESINVDLNAFAGESFIYDDAYYQQRTYQLQLPKPAEESTIKTISGLENQSLEDLCLMAYGSLDFFAKFCLENDFNLNDADITLKKATFDEALIIDSLLKKILTKKGYILSGGNIKKGIVGDYRITDDGYARLTDALDIRILG